jgi:CheY-like chemotaxis protein
MGGLGRRGGDTVLRGRTLAIEAAMNDQAAKLFAGRLDACAVLADVLIEKGIVSRRELVERFERADAATGLRSGLSDLGPTERSRPALDRLDGQTVLVVEEDPSVARDLMTALEDAGAEALVAHDVAEALARISQFDFSAAVLDWRPEKSEYRAVTRRLREDGVRVLFHAAHAPADAVAACGDPIVVKPGLPDEIVRALARLAGPVSVERPVGAA